MRPFRYLLPLLLFFVSYSWGQTQTTSKEVIAEELNDILVNISNRKTPAIEVGRLIDYASTLFAPSAKIEVEYLGNRDEDKEYSPRKYFFRISKIPNHGIIIKAEDIEGIDRKGRIVGLKILEII